MNVGRYIIASIVVAIAVLVTDWILNGLILAGAYEMCAAAFETPEHIASWNWLVYVNALVFGFLLGYVYVRMAKTYAIQEGLGFGLLIGLLIKVPQFCICVVYCPYVKAIDIGWLIGGIVQFLIFGFLLAILYKPKPLSHLPEPEQSEPQTESG